MANLEHTKKTYTLNTGDKIPAIGLGTWQSKPNEVREAVKNALLKGYRHIDTALAYGNEAEVGQGIKDSGVPREEIWITTKLDNTWHHRVTEGIESSLKDLGVDYVDLYLVHWPSSTDPNDKSKHLPDWDFIKTWQEMQKLPATGKVRNIGVSNFGIKNLEKLLNDPSTKIVPAVNQIELHPNNPSPKLVAYNSSKGIHSTGYSCLGSTNSPLYKDPTLLQLAEKKGKTPQQVLLVWGIQKGWSVIPKSVSKSRIGANFEIDGWDLSAEEVNQLDNLKDRFKKAYKAIRTKFPEQVQHGSLRLQPAFARINPSQPINRAAAIRQARRRHYSTRAGSFVSYLRTGLQGDRAAYKTSRVAANISRLTSRAPFASTLRPNLTGGTLGRTAGGYTIGAGRIGGARYFSHGPAAPAQVVQNVSMGVRAFFLSGQKARFDGIDAISGNKKYKAVSALQDQAERKMMGIPRTAPGSFIDFQLSPTITAFGLQKKFDPSGAFACETLNSEGLLDCLSADFARALKDLSAVLNDLKRLSTLGDLPILLHDRSTLRVRFPGCDAATVERLCDEVGVQRGKIMQDEDFDIRTGADLALLFPFAPSIPASPEVGYFFPKEPSEPQAPEEVDWQAMMSPKSHTEASPELFERSGPRLSFEDVTIFGENPWQQSSSSSGYSSVNISELGDRSFFCEISSTGFPESSSEYDGSDGIHRFIAECNRPS
ncbi:NADP-dependent oxidoreductase domain-containing protein [Aspergillus alliaceus]|uniref:NADP-dependent oxidoreductase domain-containing protein n=1 Tax=Petromyces alliaceus TaxID=209559 RepID=UPI0012A45BE5|nr:NADP-dependent oxidoreductase domain-containing protein [Aspergillus alliaceus]KAB8238810.1 NADP-dependent oxidoreductase domain-containing protein [Aspergillus alliaceus]